MADLAVVVPTRGRPAAVAELLRSIYATAAEPGSVAVVVSVDADDPELAGYRDMQGRPEYAGPVSLLINETQLPGGHVKAINLGAELALEADPVAVAKFDDDHRPRTRGWDTLMIDALADLGAGIVYGNDLYQGARLPTAPAISASIVRALGYMGPPVLGHLYVDDYWRELGSAAGCLRYLPGVIVEHMHPAAGKAQLDDGYRRANAPERYAVDGDAWRRFAEAGLAADVAKVRALRP